MARAVFAGDEEGPDEPGTAPARPFSVVGSGERDEPAAGPLAMVVEDDPSMRLLVTVNLELAGFRVVAAATGEEGLELAASEQPDVVLLDVMLPDLGGFEVATRLPSVPIVFVSARTSDPDLERAREVGAIDYVTKPFDPIALPARLREDLAEFHQGGADRVWAMRFGQRS